VAPQTSSPWRIDRKGVIAIVGAALLLLVAAGSWFANSVQPGPSADRNPLGSGRFYVNPDSSAVRAAADTSGDSADADAIQKLAATPQAIWLVPEEHPTASITAYVRGVVADAAATDTVAAFVVYGIPERDCGNQSAGGLTAEEYPLWVSAIAEGLGTETSAVVLEPDSLALANKCGNVDSRIITTQDAIGRLADSGAVVYLDGGHSNWHPAAETADILKRAGIDRVRGFATNVSNYNATTDEVAYAEQVSALTGDAHFVVDTGRNGNGSNGEWCNPSGRAVGDAPASSADGHHDANLWIKTPGESDGECNGGPPAGEWWDSGALGLLRN
jgi:endoglucanase